MFILFGLDSKISDTFAGENGWCTHCNNSIRWHYYKQTNWFSLFFIPVIPFQKKFYKACPICKQTIEIYQQEFGHFKSNHL
ncbi:zinc-ribbon domain-containing protein [Prolixibacteraceae bacterium JC049]|nr:zinc-ribbon domain-containing protein [Prolixibacteraceae bacterium JC049]